ncbi:hypothetical protein NBM05_03765 [Rothia sp. AR01]|uniref:Uncharacterized protein n=1 Tax=Rothia santali TaxID=2949643 RepID=A0A9X2HBQ4_9MICC|nr:hypothetical protein [Rothia santali]MCP3425165.1 hypothetical protein [Rothia santali]
MAAPKRKSSTKIAARERARAAAAAQMEREQRLLGAAEGFFSETLEVDAKREELRAKIAELEEQLKGLDAPAENATTYVQQMKAEGLKNAQIAERLELTTGEVARYLKLGASKTAAADSSTNDAATQDSVSAAAA